MSKKSCHWPRCARIFMERTLKVHFSYAKFNSEFNGVCLVSMRWTIFILQSFSRDINPRRGRGRINQRFFPIGAGLWNNTWFFLTWKCFLNFEWESVPKFGAYDLASGKNPPQSVKTEGVLIFGASHSNLIRHERPFGQQPDFQEKLSEFDNIPNNKTPLSRKKRKQLSTQAEFAEVVGSVPAARAWECVSEKML